MANPPFFDGWRSDFPERPTRPAVTSPVYTPGDPDPLPTFIWVAITVVGSVLGIIIFLWSMAAMGGFDQ